MKLFRVFFCAIIMTACATEDRVQQESAQQAGKRIAEALRRGDLLPACDSEVNNAPSSVVVVNAEICVSCLEVPQLMRELGRAEMGRKRTHIAIPESERMLLCDLFRRERVRLPVLAVPARYPGPNSRQDILFIELDSGQQVIRIDSAKTGPALLESLRSRSWIANQRE